MHHVIIAGSRDIEDVEYIRGKMNALWAQLGPYEVITGGARGVDRIAHDIATEAGVDTRVFPAEWNKHGRRAGYLRNVEMARHATHLLAFWDGESRGTKHMMDIATERGLRVTVWLIPKGA